MPRVLLCATLASTDALAQRVWSELGTGPVETVTDAFDAVTVFGAHTFTHVVIDGELDARGGVRVASALASRGEVPTVLVVGEELRDEVRRLVQQRRLAHVRVVCWNGGRVPALFGQNEAVSRELRAEVAALASRRYAAVVLLGSAGTPHMLPVLVPKLDRTVVPLVVAVHHNPRLSESFAEWVGELANMHAERLLDGFGLPALTVVRTDSGMGRLLPDLDAVLVDLHARSTELLIIVASGMQFEGVAALRVAVDDGATLVALDPQGCPQPAMVQRVVEAGLQPTLCTQDEIAGLIQRATRNDHPVQRRSA